MSGVRGCQVSGVFSCQVSGGESQVSDGCQMSGGVRFCQVSGVSGQVLSGGVMCQVVSGDLTRLD